MQRVSEKLLEQLSKDESISIHADVQQTSWNHIVLKTTGFIVQELFSILFKIKKYNADIVVFSSMVTGSLSVALRRFTSVPMVTLSHGHDVTLEVDIYQWLVPKIFKHIDTVISVSEATRQECLNRGLLPEKSVVIPNGCELPEINPSHTTTDAKKELEKRLKCTIGDKKVILTVGRLIKRKGHARFITEVLPKIEHNCFYLIVGGGNEAGNIKELISQYDGEHTIHMAGKLSEELLDLSYRSADVFAMPNVSVPGDLEGFGIVLLEANSYGIPTVATKIEGIQDVISDGESGYLISENNTDEFASKIDFILRQKDSNLRKSSRNYVEKNFSWEKVGQVYKDFFKSVIEKTR